MLTVAVIHAAKPQQKPYKLSDGCGLLRVSLLRPFTYQATIAARAGNAIFQKSSDRSISQSHCMQILPW